MRTRLLVIARFLVAAFAFALLVLAPTIARAAATVTVESLQPKEEDGRWKLKMTMNYGTVPPTAHVPMNFEFTQTVLYERSLTDQSPKTPILTKKPLQNQTPINESMDVGFSDASGKLFNITKFDFTLKRDHGFEAGEYTLVITRTNDGAKMGQPLRIVLQGDNEVVDRRAMVFSGEKKEPKKTDGGDAKKDEKPAEGTTPADADAAADGDTGTAPVEAPPPVEKKQGGCGCRVAEPSEGAAPALAAIVGIAILTHRRRRRQPEARLS